MGSYTYVGLTTLYPDVLYKKIM